MTVHTHNHLKPIVDKICGEGLDMDLTFARKEKNKNVICVSFPREQGRSCRWCVLHGLELNCKAAKQQDLSRDMLTDTVKPVLTSRPVVLKNFKVCLVAL